MDKTLHLIELTVELQFTGTLDEAKAFADEMDDALADVIERDYYCGEPECCGPVEPEKGHPSFALVSSSIKDFPEEQD